MTGPRWQLVGDRSLEGEWLRAWARGGWHVVSVGPGNRIEFIEPAPVYNWAEGSRAIEARRGASAMRTAKYDLDQARWLSVADLQLQAYLAMLDRQLVSVAGLNDLLGELPAPKRPTGGAIRRIIRRVGRIFAHDHGLSCYY